MENKGVLKNISDAILSASQLYECAVCREIFLESDQLTQHLISEHLENNRDDCEEIASSNPPARGHIQCPRCHKMFRTRVNMYRHMRNIHKADNVSKLSRGAMECPLCDNVYQFHRILVEHLEADHSIEIEQEEIRFQSVEGFEQWRQQLEKDHSVSYVKRTKTKNNTTFLLCHQSGRPKQDTNVTVKMGKTCPARIILYTNGNTVKVKHYKTHICLEKQPEIKVWKVCVCDVCGIVVTKKNLFRHYKDVHGISK